MSDPYYELAKINEKVNEIDNRVSKLESKVFTDNSLVERITRIEADVKWLKKNIGINTVVNIASWLTILSILLKIIWG